MLAQSLARTRMSESATTWLSRKEAARFLAQIGCPISPKTLENLALNNNAGKGPPFTRVRKYVRYDAADLRAWAEKSAVRVN